MRTTGKIPIPVGIALVGLCLIFGILTLSIGVGVFSNVASQFGGAISGAFSKVSSQAPATVAPSDAAVDTPILDAPPNQGFTKEKQVALSGSVPGAAIGRSGYLVRIFNIAADGHKGAVADVSIGSVARFLTPTLNLVEGPNAFVAVLVTPSGEGASSPPIVYTLDTKAPAITITSPPNNSTQTGTSVHVTGTTDPGATVTIRNPMASGGNASNQIVGGDGKFDLTVSLVAGNNPIQVMSTDQAGNLTTVPLMLKRPFGQLKVSLTADPAKIDVRKPTPIKLIAHATSANGGPLANVSVTFTLEIYGLGAQTQTLTTDATGTAMWTTTVTGASPGPGMATVDVILSTGDRPGNSVPITTY